jgi:hypothetical protein
MPRYQGKEGVTQKIKLYLKDDDVMQVFYLHNFVPFLIFSYSFNCESNPPSISAGDFPLRVDQLTFRQHEIYLAYDTFKQLVSGEKHEVIDGSMEGIDWKSWSRKHPLSGKGPVRYEEVALLGHSFGGATMVNVSEKVLLSLDH